MNFNHKLIPIVWKWIAWIVGIKNLEENRPELTKNWLNEKKRFEIFASEISMEWKNWRELRKCELTNSPGVNREKVTLPNRSSHHKYRSCRKEWIIWMILENLKMQNRFAVENYPTFPVIRQLFQVLVGCWAATKVCDLKHEICLEHRETFLPVHVQWSIRLQHLIKEYFTFWNQSATGENPVRDGTGKLVARSEERNRETIPMPRFLRRPSTMSSFFPAEGSYSTELRDWSTETADLRTLIWQIPTPSTFSCWKIRLKTQVSACSSSPRRQCNGSKKWRWSIPWTIFKSLAQGRWLRVLQYRWNYRRTTWLDRKDSEYRNCNSTKFPNPQSFLVWKIRFKTQVTTFWFSIGRYLWIKEVEMVDSLEELTSSRSVAGKNFPNFEMLDARIAPALNKIIQNSYFKKKVSLEEEKA